MFLHGTLKNGVKYIVQGPQFFDTKKWGGKAWNLNILSLLQILRMKSKMKAMKSE